jgi:hypothetical protein
MTQAFNLSQLANKLNTSGQLDGSTGLTGTLTSTGLSITGNSYLATSSGSVGIGTASPSTNLEISTTVFTPLKLTRQGTVGGSALAFANGNGVLGSIGSDASNNMLFYAGTGATQRMSIDTTGNVTVSQAARGTITTDNDLSFDLNAASNFKCTPSAGGSLIFTNIASASGQSGWVLLVNGSSYAITAAATTKVGSSMLSTISATGTYLLSYFCDGTNVYVTNSGALA